MISQRRLFALVAILCTASASAFWSGYAGFFEIHRDITTQALSKPQPKRYQFQGVSYTFNAQAITAINAMHKTLDDPNGYAPYQHFDAESFVAGVVYLQQTHQDLVRELATNPAANQSAIWQDMGKMLHLIQDFYAHSNYDTSFAAPPPPYDFATHVLTGAPPADWGGILLPTCNDLTTLLSDLTIITTGYYPPNPAPSGKCDHGWQPPSDSLKLIGANCELGIQTPADGIARDSPCFPAFADNALYFARKDLAEQETEIFVQSITDQLDNAGNAAGFCALLGLPANNPPCSPSGSISVYSFGTAVSAANGVPNLSTGNYGCGGPTSPPPTTISPGIGFANDDATNFEFHACMTAAGQWIPKSHSWSINWASINNSGGASFDNGSVSIDASGALTTQDSGIDSGSSTTEPYLGITQTTMQSSSVSIAISVAPPDYSGSFSEQVSYMYTLTTTGPHGSSMCETTTSDNASGTDVAGFGQHDAQGSTPLLLRVVTVAPGGSLPADCTDDQVSEVPLSSGVTASKVNPQYGPAVLKRIMRVRPQ